MRATLASTRRIEFLDLIFDLWCQLQLLADEIVLYTCSCTTEKLMWYFYSQTAQDRTT